MFGGDWLRNGLNDNINKINPIVMPANWLNNNLYLNILIKINIYIGINMVTVGFIENATINSGIERKLALAEVKSNKLA